MSEIGNAEEISATVQTDLAVTALLATTVPAGLEVLPHEIGLPPLPNFSINLHLTRSNRTPVVDAMARAIRDGFLGRQRQAA